MAKPDIFTLLRTGHIYFALTVPTFFLYPFIFVCYKHFWE